MSREFVEAVQEYARSGRHSVVTVAVEFNGGEAAEGRTEVYVPFQPRFLVIDTAEDLLISDIRVGAESQTSGWPARSIQPYSLKTLTELLQSDTAEREPSGKFTHPAWDLCRFEVVGEVVMPGSPLFVRLAWNRNYDPKGKLTVRCMFIGIEPKFVPWNAEIHGTLHTVAMGPSGPFVQVQTRDGTLLAVPCAAAEVPLLMGKIGKTVQFKMFVKD
jgi:hypothetical protein